MMSTISDAILFENLGFRWDRAVLPITIPSRSIERACFRLHKMLPEFVWDAAVLEGNPFTFSEVRTLLDGITVGGHRLADQDQVLNLAESARHLLRLVRNRSFRLDKPTFVELNGIVARNEALEWGVFRGEGRERDCTPRVSLGEYGHYEPPPTIPGAPELNRIFAEGVALGRRVLAILCRGDDGDRPRACLLAGEHGAEAQAHAPGPAAGAVLDDVALSLAGKDA